MTTAYTSLLGLALPVTGELSGTWGQTVNDSITSLLDSAIAGTTTLSSDVDVTLTTTQGAANTSREAIILWTAGGTVTRTITVPAQSKIYTVINKTSSTQSIKIVGAGPTTGVTIIAGEATQIAWNGVDFVKVGEYGGDVSFRNVTVTGTTTLSGLTASTALALDASKNVVSVTNTGTGNNVLATSPTLVTPILGTPTSVTLTNATGLPLSTGVTGTLATTNGGTGLTSFTANGVVYASSTSALATGSALTFDGTNLKLGTTSSTNKLLIDTAVSNAGNIQLPRGGFIGFSNAADNGNSEYLFANSGALEFGVDGTTRYSIGSTGISIWSVAGSEQMRLTSTGLGIGTSSPSEKLEVYGSTVGGVVAKINNANASGYSQIYLTNSGASGRSYVLASGGNSSASGFANNFYIYDTAAAATRLTLDSSGNLGLGVTPSASTSNYRTLQIGGGSATTYSIFGQRVAGNAETFIGWNAYGGSNTTTKGTGFYYVNTGDAATMYSQNSVHAWYTAPSGTAGNAITFTQAMTLDASGNLLVGTTTSSGIITANSNVASQAGTIYTRNTSSNGGAYSGLTIGNDGSSNRAGFLVTSSTQAVPNSTYFYNSSSQITIAVETANPLIFQTSGTERARIDSSGNLLVGTTSSTQGGASVFGCFSSDLTSKYGISVATTQTSGTGAMMQFVFNGTQVGSIATNSVLTAYNTTSDYRLKTVVGAVTGQGARIDALQPIEYTWNSNGESTRGFLAHQFQEVYAGSVTGTKDAVNAEGKPVYQAMQASSSEVIADLVAEIQSLRTRLAALEAK